MLGLIIKVIVVAAALALLIAMAGLVRVMAMQWRDVLSPDRWQEVFGTLGRNKLRTALTAISVAWGIFVLVFLLGLGRGLDNGMRKSFARDATNGVWVHANKTSVAHGGYDVGRKIMFDNRDYDLAKKTDGIDHISGQHWIKGSRWGASMMSRYGSKANAFQVDAVHPATIHLQAHQITTGRFLTEADVAQRRKSAVIGKGVAQFLFEGTHPIGEWIVIGGVPFQVIGVFSDPGGAEEERRIYVPISTAQLAYNGADDIGRLEFTVGDAGPEEAQAIIDQVVGQLAEKHNFSAEDKQAVRVHSNVEQFGRFSMLFLMISMFVIVIGLGTLAAGVVGVSNIMMIAVKERTKEIGVRKALGATPDSIIAMILQEAVFLTGIAGLLGMAGGVALLEVVGGLENEFISEPGIDLKMAIAATAFLILAGALAGYFPARAAAKVNPIHALRDQ